MSKFNTVTKSLSLAAVTLLAAMPFASHADQHDAAMDACVKAFVAANLPKEQRVSVRKEAVAASPISIHARSYKILLSAKGAETGKSFGRGSCLVDRRGVVIALNGKPLPTQLAAR